MYLLKFGCLLKFPRVLLLRLLRELLLYSGNLLLLDLDMDRDLSASLEAGRALELVIRRAWCVFSYSFPSFFL